jgi:hypothetical protein
MHSALVVVETGFVAQFLGAFDSGGAARVSSRLAGGRYGPEIGWWWALIPGGLLILTFLYRTWQEDRFLASSLPSYEAYARQTRYRLVPGIGDLGSFDGLSLCKPQLCKLQWQGVPLTPPAINFPSRKHPTSWSPGSQLNGSSASACWPS